MIFTLGMRLQHFREYETNRRIHKVNQILK